MADLNFTYINNNNNYRSRLDRVYAKQVEIQKMFEYNITPVAFSDHDAIFITIKWGSRPRWGRGTWAMNTQVLENPCFDLELKTLIEIYKANREILSNAESWDLFKKDIKNLATEISTKRRKENDYEIMNLNKTLTLTIVYIPVANL